MCGIYGLVGSSAPPTATDLARMSGTLAHRGPDGDHAIIRGFAGLGCRRLAVVDIDGGSQPLANERDDVLCVCNGELYNATALRRELSSRGHVFRTQSDVEVIPHLYEEHGIDFVHELDGMFAVALWDTNTTRLVLARDRLGEKPLYYATAPGAFFFASEPKALLATGRIDPGPDWRALSAYLRHGYVPSDMTAYATIRKLPPGGRIVIEGERFRLDRFWQVTPFLASPPLALDLPRAADALRGAFERAVTSALMSDVPVGVFLSGGLDSTAVTAVARAATGPELRTFALGFDSRAFDESDHAAFVARALGTKHHTLRITPELFLDGTRRLAASLDEPLADPALVPTFLLAREARSFVKVVLVGEGSDELFAGYPSYLGAALASHYARLPIAARRALAAAAPLLGAPHGNTTLGYLTRRFLEAAGRPAAARHHTWIGCFDEAGLVRVATPGGPLAPPAEHDAPTARSDLDMLLGLDLTNYLPDNLLVKLDRATMAASLEGRAPFLDHHLVELACRLPAGIKLRGTTGKVVLRRAVGDLVPRTILARKKRGLTVPLAEWIAGPLLPFVRDTLGRLDPAIVRPSAVRDLLVDHLARRRDNRRELWALVMLQLWHDAFLRRRP